MIKYVDNKSGNYHPFLAVVKLLALTAEAEFIMFCTQIKRQPAFL